MPRAEGDGAVLGALAKAGNASRPGAYTHAMCLIAFAWMQHPAYRLVLAANRDEYHARPTQPLDYWTDRPGVLGGRDGLAGGSWLAVARGGRVAAVTNVRTPAPVRGPVSRGQLIIDFLVSHADAGAHAPPATLGQAGPCNLLLFDSARAGYHANHPAAVSHAITPGVHGLSNAALDTPWPKTQQLRAALADALAGPALATEPLFAALADETRPPDAALPDTGIGLVRERRLAPAFIRGATYGTRASTLVLVDHGGHGTIIERRFGPNGVPQGETTLDF